MTFELPHHLGTSGYESENFQWPTQFSLLRCNFPLKISGVGFVRTPNRLISCKCDSNVTLNSNSYTFYKINEKQNIKTMKIYFFSMSTVWNSNEAWFYWNSEPWGDFPRRIQKSIRKFSISKSWIPIWDFWNPKIIGFQISKNGVQKLVEKFFGAIFGFYVENNPRAQNFIRFWLVTICFVWLNKEVFLSRSCDYGWKNRFRPSF